MSRLFLALELAIVVSAGCHDSSSLPPQAPQTLVVAPEGDGGAVFAQVDPRRSVAHLGVRRFEFPNLPGPAGSYRERITTDGHGRYALEPLDPHTYTADEWEPFELILRAREGFLFRYRDFLVRDAVLFASNWSTTLLPQPAVIAGRSCSRYRVERNVGEPVFFELCLDTQTSLVLESREFDAAGRLLAVMSYESFELDPDVTAVVWHVPANEEQVLDPLVDLEAQVGEPLLRPRLLPVGYRALEYATVLDGQGRRWLKSTFTNGVEPLFLLQALRGAGGRDPARRSGPVSAAGESAASSVVVFSLGAATAIQGTVDGFELMVIGRTSEAELLDLIESSRP